MTNSTASSQRTGLAFWAPLIAASLALFIVVVDSTMMNVAVPTIVKDLKTNVSAVQGVISFYSLIMASLMLVGGKMGGVYGVKTTIPYHLEIIRSAQFQSGHFDTSFVEQHPELTHYSVHRSSRDIAAAIGAAVAAHLGL